MCAAWKKKNERNEIVCFYCTQSDILLCGIARFSRGNKNKLRTFQPQKWKKIKNSQPQTKFTGSYKKKSVGPYSKKKVSNVFAMEWVLIEQSLRCHFQFYLIRVKQQQTFADPTLSVKSNLKSKFESHNWLNTFSKAT